MKRTSQGILTFLFAAFVTTSNASIITDDKINLEDLTQQRYPLTADENTDYSALAEQCRQFALQLDSLSQNQTRSSCIMNLDGLDVYFASNYISTLWINKAINVLTSAIYQVKYAYDIGCYDQTSILNIINGLTLIKNKLNDSRQIITHP